MSLKYIRQSRNNGANMVGVEIPLGAVFGRFAPDKKYAGNVYFYITPADLQAWHVHENSAFVHVLDGEMRNFRRRCVNLQSTQWRQVKRWIMSAAMEIDPAIKTECSRKQCAAITPRDRKPQVFILRGRPENNHIMTDYSVTAGCKIGPRWWTEEAYLCKLGVHTPDYGV